MFLLANAESCSKKNYNLILAGKYLFKVIIKQQMDMLILVLNIFKVNNECLRSGIFIVNFDKTHHKIYKIKLMFLFVTLNMYLPA